jgi:hypothetical protein
MSLNSLILVFIFLMSLVLVGSSQAPLVISKTKGMVNLVDKKYNVIVNNVTVASIKVRPSVYNYYVIGKNDVLIVFLYNTPLNFSVEDIYVERIGKGLEYAISMNIKINRSCPSIARGWIKSSSGPPLTPILEELRTSECIVRIETLGIPLSVNSWAFFDFEWNSSQALVLFGPIKGHGPSSSESNTTKQTLPQGLISLTNVQRGLKVKSPAEKSFERAVALLAIGLSVFASIASLVYEVGMSRKGQRGH